jgi:outer membrane protein assembly factor BamB
MGISTSKTKATIALVLMLTITATLMATLPIANAAIVEEETTIYLSVDPNPVGVGQTVGIGVWTYPIPLTSNDRYDGIQVVMTKPDGSTQTFGPVTSGPLGNWVWQYVPPVEGEYKFQASWPGKTWYGQTPPRPENVTRLGSTSPVVTLVVQQQPVEPLPDTPLPSEYWTYPINAQNRLWAGLTGEYPYGSAPRSAHVLWTLQNAFGGIEGGMFGSVSYASGTMYESKKSGSFILNGRYYQYGSTQIPGAGDRYVTDERTLYCYDLATGEVLWTKPISVSFTQIYEYNSVNQVGLHAYLWGTSGSTWSMYDAFDGDWIMDFVNARSGTRVIETTYTTGETGKGNILQYMLNNEQGWMALWNFTKACDSTGRGDGVITYQSDAEKEQFGVYGGQWRPRSTATNDWMRGIEWNVTFTPETDFRFTRFNQVDTDAQVGITAIPFTATYNNKITIYGYSLDPNHPGRIWGPVNLTATYTTGMAVGSGAVVLQNPTDMKFYGYNIKTGALKWESDPGAYPWGAVTDIGARIFYDRLYAASYDALHCYDMENGTELWNFYYGDAGVETPYGQYVGRFSSVGSDGNGKIFCSTGVWHPMKTYQRGDRLFCIDAYTGTMIWNYSGYWTSPRPIANGYVIGLNEYDQRIYCFNKGPSKTTVSVSQSPIAKGGSTVILGTVTDQSPASKDTPAIADKFMTQWMEYLHQQQPRPMDAFGVPVMLQAMRSDGSIIDLATIYSDINGHYEYMWTPPAQDTYKILAAFPGSDAYSMSWAETALGVTEAPPAEPEPEPEEAPAYTAIDLAIIAAVAVAIIIGIVNLWALRKK